MILSQGFTLRVPEELSQGMLRDLPISRLLIHFRAWIDIPVTGERDLFYHSISYGAFLLFRWNTRDRHRPPNYFHDDRHRFLPRERDLRYSQIPTMKATPFSSSPKPIYSPGNLRNLTACSSDAIVPTSFGKHSGRLSFRSAELSALSIVMVRTNDCSDSSGGRGCRKTIRVTTPLRFDGAPPRACLLTARFNVIFESSQVPFHSLSHHARGISHVFDDTSRVILQMKHDF